MDNNVFNYNFDECLIYLDNVSLTRFSNKSYHRSLQWSCLNKQRELIRTAIICDCIDFLGLSKLLNWDKMGTHKPLLMALFTDYIPIGYSHLKIQCKERIMQSMQNNFINQLSKNEIIELIDFTKYRIQHIELINHANETCLNPQKSEETLIKYKQFTDNIAYAAPYPFTINEGYE